jgi:hypothetical protein
VKTKNAELEDMLVRLTKLAPAMRTAGMTHVAIGELSFSLAPADVEADEIDAPTAPPQSHIDPMKDASTYVGGRVPGYQRPKKGTT